MPKRENIISKTWVFNDKVAKKFDLHVKQSVPFYSVFQKHIAKISEFFLKNDSLIYDLGCSTGKTIEEIFKLKIKTKFRVVGVDQNKLMIRLAKQKLKKYKRNNLNLISSDLKNFKLKKCNLVISVLIFPFLSLSIRNKLLKQIYNKLEIGGALITVEKIKSKHGIFEDLLNQLYYDFKLDQKISEKNIILKTKSLRTGMNVYDQEQTISFLKQNKFKKIDIFFKMYNFVGIIAFK